MKMELFMFFIFDILYLNGKVCYLKFNERNKENYL